MNAEIRYFSIRICAQCLALEGSMCHNPACGFCRRTMTEVRDYLDVLLIRPLINGQPLDVDDGVLEDERRQEIAAPDLLEAAKHVAMEWRLHGQLTDSCRVLEAAIAKATEIAK